jgi:glutaredoxin 3
LSSTRSVCRHCTPDDKNVIANTVYTDDGAAIQDALEDITKQRSVPNIFIGQKHIGGNSELQAKKSQLNKLLKDANAI